MFKKLKQFAFSARRWALKHKFRTAVILVAVILVCWFAYKAINKTAGETRYVLAAVEKGTLITSVDGSGQVSASNQVEIQPKASGDIISVSVKAGQTVKSGAAIAQINAKDALKSVRDAQSSLASAKLSLEKLQKPTEALTILQAENSLAQAQESKIKAQDDLIKAYEDGFNNVADVFLNLPTVMTGLHDIIYGFDYSKTQANLDFYGDSVKNYDDKVQQYRDDTDSKYQTARVAYDKNFDAYKSASRFSATSTIEDLVSQTYDTTKDMAEAIKSANNLVQFYADKLTEHDLTPAATASTHLSSLNSYTGKTNTYLLTLLSVKRTIQTDKETIINSSRSIEEKTASLAKLKAGTDTFDLQSQQLSVQQRQNALRDAQEKLADYTVRAPFDGVLAKVDVARGDTVSSGTIVATIITQQKIAEIALNEVDAAKVKAGQKVTLTFDAVEDLNLTGTVAEMDTLGTVSQGVVTYNVKIVFDTQDERVKSGMTVEVSIMTEVKADVLLVPNSAVKTDAAGSYVEILSGTSTDSAGITSATPPTAKDVVIGSANDTMTEIISGLAEGDLVIERTVTVGATTKTTGASMFQMGGGTRQTSGGASGRMMPRD